MHQPRRRPFAWVGICFSDLAVRGVRCFSFWLESFTARCWRIPGHYGQHPARNCCESCVHNKRQRAGQGRFHSGIGHGDTGKASFQHLSPRYRQKGCTYGLRHNCKLVASAADRLNGDSALFDQQRSKDLTAASALSLPATCLRLAPDHM